MYVSAHSKQKKKKKRKKTKTKQKKKGEKQGEFCGGKCYKNRPMGYKISVVIGS